MNILFVNLPYSGHVIPTIGLVRELVLRNQKVTYILTPQWEIQIKDAGAEFLGFEEHKKLSILMRRAYDKAVLIAENFDVIIYEQYFFLGKHLAEKFNKPAIRIFTSLASNEKLMKSFISSGGAMGIFKSKWICRQWTKQVAIGIQLKTDCWLKEILENPPDLNLVYTIREFQPYANEFQEENFKFIGSSISQHKKTTNFPFAKSKYPLIYISFGTIVNNVTSFYRKCLTAFADEKVEVIMSIGNNFNKNRLGNIPSNFMISPHLPQLEVLEKAAVFITHGGLNSVTEAIYFGVPMVVLPIINDQPVNAQRIETLNIGKSLNHKILTSQLLRDTVMTVLNDNIIDENIRSLQIKMQEEKGNEYGGDLIIKYLKEKIVIS